MAGVSEKIYVIRAGAGIARSLAKYGTFGSRVRIQAFSTHSREVESGSSDTESSRIGNRDVGRNERASLVRYRSENERAGIIAIENTVEIEVGILGNRNRKARDRPASL